MSIHVILFSVLAFLAIATAVLMITRRSPVVSVLYLIANFFVLATLYLMLHAQFIAIIQILVYAGAIMVLFLFVIMLLNLGDEKQFRLRWTNWKTVGAGLAAAVLVQIAAAVLLAESDSPNALAVNSAHIGTVESVGEVLFTKYVFPFEVTGILLLVAIVGAIVLAKKRFQ